MSYDSNCEDLARHFLQDEEENETRTAHEERVVNLAQAIQDAVEWWFEKHPVSKLHEVKQ